MDWKTCLRNTGLQKEEMKKEKNVLFLSKTLEPLQRLRQEDRYKLRPEL